MLEGALLPQWEAAVRRYCPRTHFDIYYVSVHYAIQRAEFHNSVEHFRRIFVDAPYKLFKLHYYNLIRFRQRAFHGRPLRLGTQREAHQYSQRIQVEHGIKQFVGTFLAKLTYGS